MTCWRAIVLMTVFAITSGGAALAQHGGPSRSPSSTPTISSVSPAVVRAGYGEECTVIGSGFGTGVGATIEITSALSSSQAFVEMPSDHIVSWTDTAVVFRVPATSTVVAGTGPVRVRLASGAVVTSPSVLTVSYGVVNVLDGNSQWVRPRLASNGPAHAFTFALGRGMTDAHVKALRRALTTWRCATGLPLELATSPAIVSCATQDGMSTIGFDGVLCRLPTNQPADVQVGYQTCGGTQAAAFVAEVDIVLNEGLNWNLDVQAPMTDQWDLESVLIHAIGRAIGLTYSRNTNSVLSESILRSGVSRRSLDPSSDSAGGTAIREYSVESASCSSQALNALVGSTCSIAAPLAVFTSTPSTGCGTTTVRFTTQSPYAATSIQWDVDNDGVWDATSSTVDFTYASPGVYTVRLRVENSFGIDDKVYPSAIIVHPRPRADAGADHVICSGQTVKLGGIVTAGGTLGPYSVRWSPGRVMSDSTALNPTVRINATTMFVVTVRDGRGCESVDTVVVTTNESPVLRVTGDTLVCSGQTATLRASITSGFPPFLFSWSGHSGLTGASSQTPRFAPTETTILTVVVTDARGCSTTERVTVVVSTQLPPTILAPRGTFACQGASVPLTASSGTATEIEWSTGQTTPSILVATTGRYQARSRNATGCWSDWEGVDVTIGKAPNPAVVGRAAVCSGASTTLAVEGDFVAFRWSQGDTTRTVTIVQPGDYTVRALHTTGCWSDDVAVIVSAGPQPDKPSVEQSGNTLTAVGGQTWQWYNDGQRIDGATGPSYTVVQTGRYAVASISDIGCESLSDYVDVSVISSVQHELLTSTLTIIPNPASTMVEVQWSSAQASTVQLVDLYGRTVHVISVHDGTHAVPVPLGNIANGWYLVRVIDIYGRVVAPVQSLLVQR